MVNLKLWLSKSSSLHRQLHGGRGLNSQSLACESHTSTLGYHAIPLDYAPSHTHMYTQTHTHTYKNIYTRTFWRQLLNTITTISQKQAVIFAFLTVRLDVLFYNKIDNEHKKLFVCSVSCYNAHTRNDNSKNNLLIFFWGGAEIFNHHLNEGTAGNFTISALTKFTDAYDT